MSLSTVFHCFGQMGKQADGEDEIKLVKIT